MVNQAINWANLLTSCFIKHFSGYIDTIIIDFVAIYLFMVIFGSHKYIVPTIINLTGDANFI